MRFSVETGMVGLMKKARHGRSKTFQTGRGFPRMRHSRSARLSMDLELLRLRGMSIEARIIEALSIPDRFSWLQPTLKDG